MNKEIELQDPDIRRNCNNNPKIDLRGLIIDAKHNFLMQTNRYITCEHPDEAICVVCNGTGYTGIPLELETQEERI